MKTEEANATPPTESASRWPKYAVLLGLVIAFTNIPLYVYLMFQSPVLRDVPWVNVPYSWLGLVLGVIGTWFVFQQQGKYIQKGLASTALVLTLAVVGLFNFYVFSYSYSLPESSEAIAVGETAPGFALLNQKNHEVKLSDYRGKKVVLVFYRGFW